MNETGLVVICVATFTWENMSELSDNFDRKSKFCKGSLGSSEVEILKLGQCKKITESNTVQILDGVNLTNHVPAI